MIYDYSLTVVFASGPSWEGKTITRELCVRATALELGDILRALNASHGVLSYRVVRSITIPNLTKMVGVSLGELGIKESELEKFKND